jgi:hypothetical protein
MTYYVVRTFINIAFIFSLTSISNCYYYVPTLVPFIIQKPNLIGASYPPTAAKAMGSPR